MTLVTLTEAGETAVETWSAQGRELASRLFADLDPMQLSQFVAALDHVLERLGLPWADST